MNKEMVTKSKFEYLEKIQNDLDLCTECGYYTFWCPVYREDPQESSVSRGKIAMLKGVLIGERDFDADCATQINRCMLCGACLEHCPEKTPAPAILLASRADKFKNKGVKYPQNIIYRWLIPHRTFFGNAVRFASWFQGIFMPKTEGTIRHLAFFVIALGKGRHIPSIAPKFLRQMVPVVNKPTAAVETKMRVSYFIGGMTDSVFPDAGKHLIDFLTRHGVEVVVSKE